MINGNSNDKETNDESKCQVCLLLLFDSMILTLLFYKLITAVEGRIDSQPGFITTTEGCVIAVSKHVGFVIAPNTAASPGTSQV